ncbi:ferredoxin [Sphingobium aquiterrae]|uniref:ferredoxin n=1 Tax=Sphingobium aquiterrae TaxID=2038656 RepID=UPI003018E980
MPDAPSPALPRAEIDHALCVGVGECIRIAPHAFRYNKERLAIFKGKGEGYTAQQLQEAADCCPMQAIHLLDEAIE